jgi:FkbM family methyltransferase
VLDRSIQEVKELLSREGVSAAAEYVKVLMDQYVFSPLLDKSVYGRLRGAAPVSINGSSAKILVYPSDRGISQELLRFGDHEPLSTRIFLSLLDPDMVVLDLGANLGYFALQEAMAVKKVYAVEPVPENFQLLRRSISLNGLSNVEAVRLAFADRIGWLKFYKGKASNWGSAFRTGVNTEKCFHVKCATVDSFLSEREPVDVVRMDIEGFEVKVIEGMEKTLAQDRLLIFAEVHPIFSGVKKCQRFLCTLEEFGFKPVCVVVGNRSSRVFPVSSMREIRNNSYLMSRIFHGFFCKGRDELK